MTEEELKRHIERVTKLVESWPKWKQDILKNSNKPTVDVPREPVVNPPFDYTDYDCY